MIIRRRHTANFTTIGNLLFEDERLAADEVGILAYLLSRPHDWEVRRPALMRRWGIGRDALKRVVDNWLRTGWARAQKTRLPNGTFDIVYEIRDEPGPSLSDEEVRRALSLVSSEAATDEIDEETSSDQGPVIRTPPPGQPGVAEPLPADPGVAKKELLKTESPRTESDQIEREAVGYDRKAAFIAAFETRWPTAATDDRARTAKACRDLPDDQENPALNGIGAFLEKLKRDGRKNVPAGWRYLEQRPWSLLLEAAKAEPQSFAPLPGGSPQAKAVEVIYGLSGKASAVHGFMRLRDRSIAYSREVTPQLLALADAPDQREWPVLNRQQAGAWNAVIDLYVALAAHGHLKEGAHAPWPWPPSKDGKIYAGTGPPDGSCSDDDLAEFAKTG